MPLRLLLYVVQEYEKLIGYRVIKGKQGSNPALYKRERIPIPKPEFFVLYNGTENLKEVAEDNTVIVVTEKIMRLSDAFIKKDDIENTLELCVKVIDVRYKSNHQSLYLDKQQNKVKQSAEKNLNLLGEYSYFINKVNEYKKDHSLEDAIKLAAKHCIKHGILREFLLKNETEVVAMLLGVYDEELEKQVLIEEAEARGEAQGRRKEKAKAAKEKIKTIIDMSLDFGYSNEEILSVLQKKLGITEQKAEEYLRKFYDKTL